VVHIKDKYDITVELVDLQRKAKLFKEERDKYQSKAKEWARKRDILNSKVGELLNQAQIEKKNRDKYNKKVKILKNEKEIIKNECLQHQIKANRIKNELDKIPPKVLNKIMKIRNQIKKLEWKYQTNVIKPEEEKEIINQIERLERQLDENKDLLVKLNSLENQLNQIKELQSKVKDKVKEIYKTAEQSQVHHEKMVDIYNQIDNKVRVEADNAHQKFIEAKKAADDCHNKFIEIIPRIKYLRKKLIQNRNDINKISEVVETRVKKALEKMKEGKRLTLDEFQLLVKSGLI